MKYGITNFKKICPVMLDFFKSIFNKLISSISTEAYTQGYQTIINMLRRVTPLRMEDLEVIHSVLEGSVGNKEFLNKKFEILKEAIRNKDLIRSNARLNSNLKQTKDDRKIIKRAIDYEKDVSFCINGNIVYGDVASDEENGYFSKEHIECLNKIPLKAKKCDFDCIVNECKSCMERRLRAEISKKLELENEFRLNEKIKKRKYSSEVVGDLNEKFGVSKTFGRFVADENFNEEDLDSEERERFVQWRQKQKENAQIVKSMINLKQEYENLKKTELNAFPEQIGTESKMNGNGIVSTFDESNFKNTVPVKQNFNYFTKNPFSDLDTKSPEVNSTPQIYKDTQHSGPDVEEIISDHSVAILQKSEDQETNQEFKEFTSNPFSISPKDGNDRFKSMPIFSPVDSLPKKNSSEFKPMQPKSVANPFSDLSKKKDDEIKLSSELNLFNPSVLNEKEQVQSVEPKKSSLSQPSDNIKNPFAFAAHGNKTLFNPFQTDRQNSETKNPFAIEPSSNLDLIKPELNTDSSAKAFDNLNSGNFISNPFSSQFKETGQDKSLSLDNSKNSFNTLFPPNMQSSAPLGPSLISPKIDNKSDTENPFLNMASTPNNPFSNGMPAQNTLFFSAQQQNVPSDPGLTPFSSLSNKITPFSNVDPAEPLLKNPFSTNNIFQSDPNQTDFLSNNDTTDDGFRRKRAYRKK